MTNIEVLTELKKIADKLGISLKDLIFDSGENLILIKNDEKIEGGFRGENIIISSEFKDGKLVSRIEIPEGFKSDKPLHFCFVLDKYGVAQDINAEWYIGKNAKVRIFAYCLSSDVTGNHIDNKKFFLEENAILENYEFHYNSKQSEIYVETNVEVILSEKAKYINEFISTIGKLGKINTTNKIYCKGNASSAQLLTKADIKKGDQVVSNSEIFLIGKETKGIVRSKSITREGGVNIFDGKIIGQGDYCKGHIECDEITLGKGKVVTKPQLIVENPTARLTHEAAVGSVERKAIENLMIKGFSEEEAIEFIVKGVLE